MRRLSSLVLASTVLLTTCGRTDLGFPSEADDSGGGFDAGDDRGDGPNDPSDGLDDGVFLSDPESTDIPDPPLPESCGNGIAEPGELCFMPQIVFWSRIDPCALDIGDIDGDGFLDVATPNSDFNHVESVENITSVLYGNGLGQLSEPVPYVTGDAIPVGIRLGDLNADGGLDIVVVNSDAGTLSVMLNLGGQQMIDAGRVSVGSGPVTADVGDIDSDGIQDVAVAVSDEVRVALGRGDGNFLPSYELSAPGALWAATLVDLDADGALDLLASNPSEGIVHRWFGDGQGNLVPSDPITTSGVPLGITDTDFDNDGTVDLLVAHSFGVAALAGNGDGDFTSVAEIEAGIDPRDVAMADFDNDGRLDAAIVNATSQDITLATGRGDGRFDYGATYGVGTLPSGIEAGDFNSDGVPDMVVSNQLSNNIGLILSNP